MTATEAAAHPLVGPAPYRWVRLEHHCACTGDTPGAVHARRRKRVWLDGVHCRLAPDGNLYVSPEEYNRWVENQQQTPAQPAQNEPSTARAA